MIFIPSRKERGTQNHGPLLCPPICPGLGGNPLSHPGAGAEAPEGGTAAPIQLQLGLLIQVASAQGLQKQG